LKISIEAKRILNMAEYAAGRGTHQPTHQPTHPGAVLREDVLPALRIGVTEAAAKLGVSRQTLHAILSERAGVSAEMAVRLGKFCGNGPAVWLRLQVARDLWEAQRDLAGVVDGIPTMQAA
jgi:addiction module HigA family antidote